MNPKKPEKTEFSREELYNLVWENPLKNIASDYLLSYGSLKKICKSHDIPLPGRGHWSKIRFGKNPSQIPLSKSLDNTKIALYSRINGDQRDLGLESKFHILKHEIENDASLQLGVPKKLTKPDPIIKETKRREKGKGADRPGTGSVSLSYYFPEVSDKEYKRALRILDTLFKAIRNRGHTFKFTYYHSIIVIDDMEITFRLREKHKRVVSTYIAGDPYHKLEPVGTLIFAIERSLHRKEWSGSKTKPLEQRISTIVAGLELFAKSEKEYQAELERGWAEQRKRKEKEDAIKEKRRIELRQLTSLLEQSDRWHTVEKFRNYLASKEQQEKRNGTFCSKTKRLIDWAREKADWMDPLVEKEDELFDEVDRTTLKLKNHFF